MIYKSFLFSKLHLQNQRGVSLVEIIIFAGIFLILALGTNQFLNDTLRFQNFSLSQTFELNLRKLLRDLNPQACINTFSGKKIGDDIDHIRDDRGISLISSPSTFKKNLKIVKIKSSPKIITCSDIQVQSGQNCPPGCTNPGSFPGPCSGTSSTSTPGYAELNIFFSRPGSLFEKKSKTGACDSSDQSQCHQQSCIVKLKAPATGDVGATGENIGKCELLDCSEELESYLNPSFPCYTVTTAGGTPPKVSLVGCGTTQDVTKEETVAFGFDAGSSSLTGEHNTFVGYQAGKYSTTGEHNTFIGYRAGSYTPTGKDNVFIGNKAGANNNGGNNNVFIGNEAGKSANNGNNNTLIGYQAGQNNKGENNTFIGPFAGTDNTIGKQNVFIGANANPRGLTSQDNVSIGSNAGRTIDTPASGVGKQNVFIGQEAGFKIKKGNDNIFIGHKAGYETQDKKGNIFIGSYTGENNNNEQNTFIGNLTGKAATGKNNVFIGYYAAANSTDNNHFVIGTIINNEWIKGEFNTNTFKIQGQQVAYWDPATNTGHTHGPSSSRTLKKNIKSFKNFDKALEDILKTPLFTFEFKKDQPQKKRIGFISEELPPHLQIKDKLSRPDMTSIRGTILAGIKALYNKIKTLKEEFSFQIKNLKTEILKEMRGSIKSLKTEIVYQLKDLGKNLETTKEEISLEIKKKEQVSNKKWNNLVEKEKNERGPLIEKLHKTKEELDKTKADLVLTKKEMENTKTQLKILGEKLHALKK
ncbi:MAG: hypothetical protein OXM55_07590 [Bdellovibrionales bacterium]|nr:hypothetical protein [Bdellovibrionales bacterium]